jgi:hypothetical protein
MTDFRFSFGLEKHRRRSIVHAVALTEWRCQIERLIEQLRRAAEEALSK